MPAPHRTPLSPPGDTVADRFGFHQAQLLVGGTRTLSIAGQVGDPAADMTGQLTGALDRLHTLLNLGGMDWPDIVQMTILTTDVEALLACWSTVRRRFEPGSWVPPNTLAQVIRFAHPDAAVEIAALAMN